MASRSRATRASGLSRRNTGNAVHGAADQGAAADDGDIGPDGDDVSARRSSNLGNNRLAYKRGHDNPDAPGTQRKRTHQESEDDDNAASGPSVEPRSAVPDNSPFASQLEENQKVLDRYQWLSSTSENGLAPQPAPPTIQDSADRTPALPEQRKGPGRPPKPASSGEAARQAWEHLINAIGRPNATPSDMGALFKTILPFLDSYVLLDFLSACFEESTQVWFDRLEADPGLSQFRNLIAEMTRNKLSEAERLDDIEQSASRGAGNGSQNSKWRGKKRRVPTMMLRPSIVHGILLVAAFRVNYEHFGKPRSSNKKGNNSDQNARNNCPSFLQRFHTLLKNLADPQKPLRSLAFQTYEEFERFQTFFEQAGNLDLPQNEANYVRILHFLAIHLPPYFNRE
ncbi:hypothetical protein CAOG_05460 [Capsaspora owczarzaki ATCC 30864]|uniref:Uncharacterized protein n=1 Tax=Capsaspora owczarzaki (strain ATCC 30864) TaxID=595528 RepID=A0A0D2X3U5_CAPO3|nr:hypothetical protein CAOG_05460 [Capsaspora owczarzaki ATCC 30864]KJE94919.1 hypothetical protein CAOG_005460 [Capsaspora owczarzaki ATCC 30864]|eukprot:XP_004346133.2 hypothetical protein CAOG_05460 [Capsaspora owczarzaki ATCC 30864]